MPRSPSTSPRAALLSHICAGLRGLATPAAALVLDPENCRLHSDENIEAIRRSLAEHGQDQPLVVQAGSMRVLKGNGRLMAARLLGWRYVAALVVEESDVDATLRSLRDNRASDLAGWNTEHLAGMLERLNALRPGCADGIFTADDARTVASAATAADDANADGRPKVFRMVAFTHEQYEVVMQAVERVRQSEHRDDLKPGRALELVCADFLAGN